MHVGFQPLPYLLETARWFQDEEPEVWQWFASEKHRREEAEAMRLDLLKRCYRLDAETHGALLTAAERVKTALGLALPVSLYQATGGGDRSNAALFFLPGEVHVVFFGRLLEICEETEIEWILGHELAHYLLWTIDGGRLRVADRMLAALAQHPSVDNAHLETARLFDLFTEVYADRVALLAGGDLETGVRALVKVETGLAKVSAASYLGQARQVLGSLAPGERGEGATHPELFRRVEALRLIAESGLAAAPSDPGDEADAAARWASAEEMIRALVIGEVGFDQWDLHRQREGVRWTRRLLREILREADLCTEAVTAHAEQFFEDVLDGTVEPLEDGCLRTVDEGWKRFASYVLLDFATVDPEVRELALEHTLRLADRLGILDPYEKVVRHELKLLKRDLKKLYPAIHV